MKRKNILSGRLTQIFFMLLFLILIYKAIDNYKDILGAIGRFLSIISPFLFGVLICYMLYKPCAFFEKGYKHFRIKFIAKHARGFSVFTVYLAVLVLLVLFFVFIIPIIIGNLVDLANNIPTYYNHAVKFINDLQDGLDFVNLDIDSAVTNFTTNTLKEFFDASRIEQITKGVLGLANGVFGVFISLIVSLYALLDRNRIINFVRKASDAFLPEKGKASFNKYIRQINKVIFTFIGSKTIDCIINFVGTTVVLLILKVKYPVLMGILTALLSFIPYLGALVGVIITCLMTLLTGGIQQMIPTFILLLIFQQIDGNYIEPKLMEDSLKISPILVLVSITVGGAYFGIVGMFLAVPFVTIVKEILVEYIEQRRQNKILKAEISEAQGVEQE